MKNSVLYIVGGITLLGAGAFLFIKNKKSKDLSKSKDLALDKLDVNIPASTNTPKTNPITGLPIAQIKDDTKNIEEATKLASQIYLVKNKKIQYTLMPLSEFSKTEEGFYGRFETNRLLLEKYKSDTIQSMQNELNNLTNQISKLGYMEVNGSIAKIN
jgi:LPXTG-motif cell wall-anchored protein